MFSAQLFGIHRPNERPSQQSIHYPTVNQVNNFSVMDPQRYGTRKRPNLNQFANRRGVWVEGGFNN